MKKIAVLLLAAILVALFPARAAAFDRSRLQKAYHNLLYNMDEDYFADGEEMDRYHRMLENARVRLSDPSSSEEELERCFNELRQSYIDLCYVTFDYSELIALTRLYHELDPSAFEAAGFDALTAEAERAEKELNSPTIYTPATKVTREHYAATKQNDIRKKYVTPLRGAFDALVIRIRKETVTKEQLSSFVALIGAFLHKELLRGDLTDLNEALTLAQEIAARFSAQEERTNALTRLSDALSSLLAGEFDHAALENAVGEAKKQNGGLYTEFSWNAFLKRIDALENDLRYSLLPSVTKEISLSGYRSEFEKWIKKKADAVTAASELLISKELQAQLLSLCDEYDAAACPDERVNEYYNRLRTASAEARSLLAQETDGTTVKNAMKNLQGAASDLQSALDFYAQEDAKAAADQTPTYVLIGAIGGALVLLSLVFALFANRSKEKDEDEPEEETETKIV